MVGWYLRIWQGAGAGAVVVLYFMGVNSGLIPSELRNAVKAAEHSVAQNAAILQLIEQNRQHFTTILERDQKILLALCLAMGRSEPDIRSACLSHSKP